MRRVIILALGMALLLVFGACTTVPAPTAPGDAAATAAPAETEGAEATPAAEEESGAAFPPEDINIMAPAAPGGGWDQTARAMQTALAATTDVNVQVYNVPGAGGTVGL